MLEFHARDWFTISGHGRVASVSSDGLPPGPSDGRDLVGQEVMIDGLRYTVKGVEWCLVDHGANVRCWRGYGLLVDDLSSAGLPALSSVGQENTLVENEAIDQIIEEAGHLISAHDGSDAALVLRYVVRLAEEVKRRS